MAFPHVLVVDGCQHIWDSLEELFARAGVHVTYAHDGNVARRVLDQGDVDLALIGVRNGRRGDLLVAEHADSMGTRVMLVAEPWRSDIEAVRECWPVLDVPLDAKDVLSRVLAELGIAPGRPV